MNRRLVAIVAVVGAGLGAASLRVVLEGRAALSRGDAAMAEHHPVDAIAEWESAARWYLPLAPHVDQAYHRLREFAKTRHSLAAWRAVRRAALATRHLWQPHADDLAAADTAIAELATADPERAPVGIRDRDGYQKWQANLLAQDPRPSTGITLLAIAGIACWLAGLGVLLYRDRAAERGKRLDRQRFRTPALIAAVGALVWVVGLYTA